MLNINNDNDAGVASSSYDNSNINNTIPQSIPHGSTRSVEGLKNAKLIPLEKISPNPDALRVIPDDESLSELASSIKLIGIMEPLLVAPRGQDQFLLISGHRRYTAAKKVGLVRVPCLLLEISDRDITNIALIENLQRSNLTLLEESHAIKALVEKSHMPLREVANKIGKSLGYVGERMAVANFPQDIKIALKEGILSLRKAVALSRVPSAYIRDKLINRGARLNNDQFKKMVDEAIGRINRPRKKRESTGIVPELRFYAARNPRVRVSRDHISLKYRDPEDLKRMISEIIDMLDAYQSQQEQLSPKT